MLKTLRLTAAALALAGAAAAKPAPPAPSAPPTPGPLPVIADITARPETAAAIRAAMTQAAATARTERGCLSYVLYEDREHPGHFLTYETWTDDAALNAHLTSPAMKAGFAKLGPLLAAPPVITRLKRL